MLVRRVVIALVLVMCSNNLVSVHAAESEVAMLKANSDLKAIQSALDKFRADNAAWPNRVNGSDPSTGTVKVLHSEGNFVTPIIWPVDDSLFYKLKTLFSADLSPRSWPVNDSVLNKEMRGYFGVKDGVENDRAYPANKWKGPYLKDTPDPWGNTYLIGSSDFEDSKMPVWILSAGPDGIVQTPINSPVCMDGKSLNPTTGQIAQGDDICLKYR